MDKIIEKYELIFFSFDLSVKRSEVYPYEI